MDVTTGSEGGYHLLLRGAAPKGETTVGTMHKERPEVPSPTAQSGETEPTRLQTGDPDHA